MKTALLFTILYLASLPFTLAGENIVITDAWVREVPPGSNVSAAYMTIENRGDVSDKLMAISSDAAENIEIHISNVDEDGVAKMEMLKVLELPPGQKVELKPGGIHLMLIGLNESLVGKEKVDIILSFDKAEKINIQVPVKSIKNSGHDHHHHH